jgi:Cytochrome oxidase complex assembly protein 1
MTATTGQTPMPAPSRRWGCLRWAALAVVLLVGAPAGCTYYLFTSLANSTPAKMGLSLAEAHPLVAAKFGTPVVRGRFGSGSIQVNGPSGSANLAVPISGPKGSGTAHISATKTAGEWRLERVEVQPDDGSSRISVLGGGIRS